MYSLPNQVTVDEIVTKCNHTIMGNFCQGISGSISERISNGLNVEQRVIGLRLHSVINSEVLPEVICVFNN